MKGHALIEAGIEIRDQHGELIAEVDGQPASRRIQVMRQNDKYKAIMGDTNARVNVGLDESIGGPYGYSSVKLRCSVTLNCDQNEESVKKAQAFALDECLTFIDDHIGTAYKVLVDHLERHYHKEG